MMDRRRPPNITGTWRLDKHRSQPIDHYLRAMGLCQIAIDGHRHKEQSTETYYVFEQTPTTLTTQKHSWSGTSRRTVTFGRTHHEPGQVDKRVSATIRGDSIVITTEMDNDRVLNDVKTLHDNGTSLKMLLSLTTPDTQVDIERWLVQSDDLSSQNDDDDDDA